MTAFLTQLTSSEISADGLDGFAYGYRDRVRFHELDALNHVNNVVFLKWFETIRVAYVQDYGFTSYTADDPMLVVRRVTCDFHAPMFLNEVYTVATRTSVLKPSSLVMEYAVASGGTLRATGEAVGVSLEQDGRTRRNHAPQAVDMVMKNDNPDVPA